MCVCHMKIHLYLLKPQLFYVTYPMYPLGALCLLIPINTNKPSAYLQTTANSFNIQAFSLKLLFKNNNQIIISQHTDSKAPQHVKVTMATWQANTNGAWSSSIV